MATNVEELIAKAVAGHPTGRQLDILVQVGDERLAAADAPAALACFDRALRLDDRAARAWVGRAQALAMQKRSGEALACVDRALDADRDSADAKILKGELQAAMGLRDEALGCFDAALASSPRPALRARACLARGQVLADLERWDDSLAAFADVVLLAEPAHLAEAHAGRAEVFARRGKNTEAAEAWESAVVANPSQFDLWFRLARTYAKLGRLEDHRRTLDRFLATAPPSDTRLPMAKSMRTSLDAPAPTPAPAARAPAPGPAPAPASAPAAISPPARSPEPSPSSPSPDDATALLAVRELTRGGRHVEALRKLEPIAKANPLFAEAWVLRASILVALGQLDAAASSLDTATKAATKAHDDSERADVEIWTSMARCFVDMKKHDRALGAADRALKLVASDAAAHRLRGEALVQLDRHVEAIYAFEKAVHHGPENAEGWLALGRTLRLVRRPNDAKPALEKALALALDAGPNASDTAAQAEDLLKRL